MTLREVGVALQHLVQSGLEVLVGTKKQFRYIKEFAIGIILLAVAIFGFLGYRWYVVYREQAAQKVFANYLKEYDKAEQGAPSDLEHAQMLFKLGYQQQSGSRLAPYFLAFQSDTLIKQGKIDEALDVMDTMIKVLPEKAPLTALYKTKRALLLLDADDESKQKTGLDALEQLAYSKENQYNDLALFYVGRYYWVTDNLDQAKKAWQELANQQRDQRLAPSPWLDQVQEKLAQIVS